MGKVGQFDKNECRFVYRVKQTLAVLRCARMASNTLRKKDIS